MVEIVRMETVGEDGMVHVAVPDVAPGESVKVTVRQGNEVRADGWPVIPPLTPDAQGRYRTGGGLEGQIWIAPDFDDPLPELEPYS